VLVGCLISLVINLLLFIDLTNLYVFLDVSDSSWMDRVDPSEIKESYGFVFWKTKMVNPRLPNPFNTNRGITSTRRDGNGPQGKSGLWPSDEQLKRKWPSKYSDVKELDYDDLTDEEVSKIESGVLPAAWLRPCHKATCSHQTMYLSYRAYNDAAIAAAQMKREALNLRGFSITFDGDIHENLNTERVSGLDLKSKYTMLNVNKDTTLYQIERNESRYYDSLARGDAAEFFKPDCRGSACQQLKANIARAKALEVWRDALQKIEDNTRG